MPYLYPHTNLNQQNLDWMINQIQALKQAIGAIALSAGNLSIAWEEAEMTDHNLIYLYLGPNEPGFINGYLYEWSSTLDKWDGLGRLIPADPLPIGNGGTGSTNKAAARAALEITPANISAEPEITSNNPLDITKGGTGAITAPAALQNLGAEPAFTTLPVTKGGTGADNVADARTSLGLGSAALQDTPIGVQYGGTGATSESVARSNLHALGSSDVTYFQTDGTAVSIAAGAAVPIELNVHHSGYTCIGIGSFFGTGTSACQVYEWYFVRSSGVDKVNLGVRNNSSSTVNFIPKVRCVYVKTV